MIGTAVLSKQAHGFKIDQPLVIKQVQGTPFSFLTANVKLFPHTIDLAERAFCYMSSLVTNEARLTAALTRSPDIAKKLTTLSGQVACITCQEAFSPQGAADLAKGLRAQGYLVIHSQSLLLNSGLFFATLHHVDEKKIRFYRFTNLVAEDQLSMKGVLHVPLTVFLKGKSEQKVFVYITHLQAKVTLEAQKARREELNAILTKIQNKQKKYPAAPIFFLGDLNITRREYGDESDGDEYEQNAENFFNHFCCLTDLTYDRNGNRKTGKPKYLPLDEKGPEEPKGSYYNLDSQQRFNAGETAPGCIYDHILFYKGDKWKLESYHAEILTLLQGLSDHLPVLGTFELEKEKTEKD